MARGRFIRVLQRRLLVTGGRIRQKGEDGAEHFLRTPAWVASKMLAVQAAVLSFNAACLRLVIEGGIPNLEGAIRRGVEARGCNGGANLSRHRLRAPKRRL
jgi:hypothetical protein